ncbi:MAG TPA: GGDEF domain-containing protein [Pseudolabrys sp.]|nr:GGDEF domain-containing protein [Pseudolabrys sp.]
MAAVVGTVTRMVMVSLHPNIMDLGSALMVGILFVIYLYLPIRLVTSVALAAAFSIVAPLWWSLSQGAALPPDQLYRVLIWLLLANALGFTAANCMQRSLRTQFAQSLLLQQLLFTDSLTGIANHRRFDSALEREWRRCRRTGAPLSLLMIDVDHFKPYNDQFGHQQGDDCLRRLARLLLDGVARHGDSGRALRWRRICLPLPECGMAGARLTISVGVATAKDLFGEPGALMGLAGKLLYAAKAAGRNQVIVGQLPAGKAAARSA